MYQSDNQTVSHLMLRPAMAPIHRDEYVNLREALQNGVYKKKIIYIKMGERIIKHCK